MKPAAWAYFIFVGFFMFCSFLCLVGTLLFQPSNTNLRDFCGWALGISTTIFLFSVYAVASDSE